MSYNQDKEEFIKYLQFQKHYSINTVESYQRSLNEFIDFLKSESISHFYDVKYTNIRGYLTYLNEKRDLSNSLSMLGANIENINSRNEAIENNILDINNAIPGAKRLIATPEIV